MKSLVSVTAVLLFVFFTISCNKNEYVIDDFVAPSRTDKVSISPQSATLGIGDSVIFTATGDSIIRGGQPAYFWSVEPESNLELVQHYRNQVRVTLISQPNVGSGYVKATGPFSEVVAIINFQ